jgi:hypothetical protein
MDRKPVERRNRAKLTTPSPNRLKTPNPSQVSHPKATLAQAKSKAHRKRTRLHSLDPVAATYWRVSFVRVVEIVHA